MKRLVPRILIFSSLLVFIHSPMLAQEQVNEWVIKISSHTNPNILKSLNIQTPEILKSSEASQYLVSDLGFSSPKDNPVDAEWVTQLQSTGVILGIERNKSFQLTAQPDDPGLSNQWALGNQGQMGGKPMSDVKAFAAWDLQTSGGGIVGLIDTGIDYSHEDLGENIWQNLAEDADGDGKVLEKIDGTWQLDPGDLDGIDADNNGYVDDLIGWDFVNNDNNPYDDEGHGTHVAGIIGAKGNNGIGIAGIAWSAKIMALKAFDQYGTGQLSQILPALEYARKMGVLVTNNSWGSIHFSKLLLEEILEAEKANQIFVAAAGNNGQYDPLIPVYPASYPAENILAIGASDDRDRLAGFSSYHPEWVDLLAPGGHIYSTLPGNRYGFKSGTSMAAPMVSAAILLLRGYNPSLHPREIITSLVTQVDMSSELYGTCLSGGRLNLFKLLNAQSPDHQLLALFEGPTESCTNTNNQFTSISHIPRPGQTSYRWEVEGEFVGNDTTLSYVFERPGWYEVKLKVVDDLGSNEYARPINITKRAEARLGSDTVICASAYVLFTESQGHQVRWKRHCPPGIECPALQADSIRLSIKGGDISLLDVESYVLANEGNRIIEIANRPVFSAQHMKGHYKAYGVYYESLNPPTGLKTGQLVQGIRFEEGACFVISNAFEFELEDTRYLGDKPLLRIRESGIYILEVEDACGNIATDSIEIGLSGDCVWPGDVNADGIVSVLDFLALGIAHGASGNLRPNSSPLWKAQYAPNWTRAFRPENVLAPSLNLKHADCNGDGIVDLGNDLQVLSDNLGFSYSLDSLSLGRGPSFFLEHVNTSYFGDGDTAAIEIALHLINPDNQNISGFYGAAFSLNFSDPVSRMPKLDFSSSWLGPMKQLGLFSDGSRNTFGSQFLPRNRKRATFAFVSSNNNSNYGRGLLASTIIIAVADDIVDDSVSSGISSFNISADNMFIIDSLGNPLSSVSASSMNSLKVQLDWEEEKTPNSGGILSLQWLDFEVEYEAPSAYISWATTNEQNTSHFSIERSLDGLLFEAIESVEATGSDLTINQYQHVDPELLYLPSNVIYYRIKQVDMDGGTSYSETRNVQLEGGGEKNFLRAYPNPFENNLLLNYKVQVPEGASLRVFNGLGSLVWEQELQVYSDNIEVNTEIWPRGIYFLTLDSESSKYVYKLVKEK